MRQVLGWILFLIVAALVLAFVAWGALMLWYTLPLAEPLRLGLAALLVLLGIGCLITAAARRRFVAPLAPFALGVAAVLGWWWTIPPSNDRDWQPDVARLAGVAIDGDTVRIENVRSFTYRSQSDHEVRWIDRSVNLDDLETLDLISAYWMGDTVAHTMLSFGFRNADPLVISVEPRLEIGETYSSLAGLFRRYEVAYLVGEESDLVALRTTWREPPEDVYLYRLDLPPDTMRTVFLNYLSEIRRLETRPAFYNTATANSGTALIVNSRALNGLIPLNWKMLLSGYLPEHFYELGRLDRNLTYAELRRESRINDRARAATGAADFSTRIRAGLPGI